MGVGIAWLLTFAVNGIASAVTKIDNIARMPAAGAVILILLSIFLNVMAGLIPSRIAAKKNPVEALRLE